MMIKTNNPTEKFAVVGNCPKCGAPIYAVPPKKADGVPMSKHSCTCHRGGGIVTEKVTKYGKR